MVQVVALLLELSADLESAPDGLTPLCLASEAGHLEVREEDGGMVVSFREKLVGLHFD